MFKVIVIGIIVTIVGLFVLSGVHKAGSDNPSSVNGYSTNLIGESDDNTVKVAISGEISHPGSYFISPEKTLGDLITMAGGASEDADSKCFNTSLTIATRTSFYIAPVLTSTSTGCVITETSKININSAEVNDLIVAGFTSSQSPSLVTYRTESGSFEALEDIMNVKGIAKGTFEKVKNKICLM